MAQAVKGLLGCQPRLTGGRQVFRKKVVLSIWEIKITDPKQKKATAYRQCCHIGS